MPRKACYEALVKIVCMMADIHPCTEANVFKHL